MTIVEFFDGVSIDNMASCLAIKPDKIIFIGENKPMKEQEEVYGRFAKSYGLNVVIDYKPINKNSVDQIVSVLTKIVESEENCAFDLTGGEDLVLVAMGIVFEKYRGTGKIQMHRFNVRYGTIYDCDSDGELPDIEPLKLTVKDNIALYGGSIVSYNGKKGTYDWNFDDEFESELRVMWEICKKNPGLWNLVTGTLGYMAAESDNSNKLEVSVNKNHIEELMKKEKCKYKWSKGIMKAFEQKGFISGLVDAEETAAFTFKNEQIKMCLTKEGTLLELIVLLYSKAVRLKDGSLKFDDAVNGVYIDWDSELHSISDEEKDTENEIDVVLMRGLVPIFVSCKNGSFDENELYKLNTVAERFGGPYAQKVLVASYYGKKNVEGNKFFVQRANDMKIQLIENVHELSEAAFMKEIRKIVC